MDFQTYLPIIARRWRFIAICAFLAVAAVAVSIQLTTPIYEAQTQIFVSTKGDGTASDILQGGNVAAQRVASYVGIINSPRVTDAVAQELGLPSGALNAGAITAESQVGTVLINIKVDDPSPQRAQAIANAIGAVFGKVVGSIETSNTSTSGTSNTSSSAVKISVMRPAALPTVPASPKAARDLILGLIVGLMIGVGTTVLHDALDRSVKNADELAKRTEAPVLGVIGLDPDAGRQAILLNADLHSSRAEAMRQLRTNLQFINADRPVRSIVVTSAVSGEGKSTLAINLALTIAAAGQSVVLVEGDLRRPSMSSYLGIEQAVGLTTLLIGQFDLDEALQPIGDDRLMVLACGTTPPNPSELLGSLRMQETIKNLQKRFDFVIIDTPPLLAVTDARVLSKIVDGVIVLVRAGKTTHEQISRAVKSLRSVDARVLGTVLNMAPTKGPDAYTYGYYDHKYYDHKPTETAMSSST